MGPSGLRQDADGRKGFAHREAVAAFRSGKESASGGGLRIDNGEGNIGPQGGRKAGTCRRADDASFKL